MPGVRPVEQRRADHAHVRVARRRRAEPDADVRVAGASGQVDGREDIKGLRHDARILPAPDGVPTPDALGLDRRPNPEVARSDCERGGRGAAAGQRTLLTRVPRPATVTVTSSPASADRRRRGAGEDHVAGQQRHHRGHGLDERRHRVDQRRGGRRLRDHAVHLALDAGRRRGRGRCRSTGPSGQNVSKPLARVHWPSERCRSRAVTSLAQV